MLLFSVVRKVLVGDMALSWMKLTPCRGYGPLVEQLGSLYFVSPHRHDARLAVSCRG